MEFVRFSSNYRELWSKIGTLLQFFFHFRKIFSLKKKPLGFLIITLLHGSESTDECHSNQNHNTTRYKCYSLLLSYKCSCLRFEHHPHIILQCNVMLILSDVVFEVCCGLFNSCINQCKFLYIKNIIIRSWEITVFEYLKRILRQV